MNILSKLSFCYGFFLPCILWTAEQDIAQGNILTNAIVNYYASHEPMVKLNARSSADQPIHVEIEKVNWATPVIARLMVRVKGLVSIQDLKRIDTISPDRSTLLYQILSECANKGYNAYGDNFLPSIKLDNQTRASIIVSPKIEIVCHTALTKQQYDQLCERERSWRFVIERVLGSMD